MDHFVEIDSRQLLSIIHNSFDPCVLNLSSFFVEMEKKEYALDKYYSVTQYNPQLLHRWERENLMEPIAINASKGEAAEDKRTSNVLNIVVLFFQLRKGISESRMHRVPVIDFYDLICGFRSKFTYNLWISFHIGVFPPPYPTVSFAISGGLLQMVILKCLSRKMLLFQLLSILVLQSNRSLMYLTTRFSILRMMVSTHRSNMRYCVEYPDEDLVTYLIHVFLLLLAKHVRPLQTVSALHWYCKITK